MNPELIAKLTQLANRETLYEQEDVNAYEASGGNYDDAYELGRKDGETILAQEILDELKISY